MARWPDGLLASWLEHRAIGPRFLIDSLGPMLARCPSGQHIGPPLVLFVVAQWRDGLIGPTSSPMAGWPDGPLLMDQLTAPPRRCPPAHRKSRRGQHPLRRRPTAAASTCGCYAPPH